MTHFDVLVLGAGPGGYVAAIRAAQLGRSVAVVEKRYWGGVCLNVGCIPSKALLKNAELAHTLTHEKAKYGIEGDATMSFGPAHARSRQVSGSIVQGVHYLMRKNKITEIDGWGTLVGPSDAGKQVVSVATDDGSVATYTCDNLILATGSTVRTVPGVVVNGRNIVSYEEQILDESLPSYIVIGGSGAIGVEFAFVLRSFGVEVTIVELLDRMVPTEDPDVSKELARHYKRLGIDVLASTAIEGVEDTGSGVKVRIASAAGGEEVLKADRFLAAFGFAPRIEGYGLDAVGIALTDDGAIAIDDRCRTNVEGVYAIGDCTGKMMLAHVAEAQGVLAAETIAGVETTPIDYDFVPRATYCQPQIGSFGYCEQQAQEKGYDVKTAAFPFAANGKAQGLGETAGFVKIVADAEHGMILGAHMIGPDVTELLPVLTLAQRCGLTVDQVSRNVFAHPTLSEAIKEATHGIAGHMINL